MKNASISVRLTFWFSAIFLVGFVAFGIAMWFDLAYSLSQGRDRTLAHRVTRFLDALAAVANLPEEKQAAVFLGTLGSHLEGAG